jgi:predicted acylesterase/phospholipase RssA
MGSSGPTALVLSAGGMFGAYQAGVWQEIADVFDPDIVVGASVGSLNGWMIACGCDARALSERWLQLGDEAEVRWRVPRHPCEGLLNTAALEREIQTLCANGQLVRRFGLVLTRIPSCRPVLFEAPGVEWTHIAASCAVPVFMRHYQIGGHWYSDGGLIDPLPFNAAVEMGARTVVSVNVMNHRPWLVRCGVGALRRVSGYVRDCPEDVRWIDISPGRPLGPVKDAMYWRKETARAMIERGRRDAREKRNAIVQLSEQGTKQFGAVSSSSFA